MDKPKTALDLHGRLSYLECRPFSESLGSEAADLRTRLGAIRADSDDQIKQLKHFLWRAAKLLKNEWSCQDKSCEECEKESCDGRAFTRSGEKEKKCTA